MDSITELLYRHFLESGVAWAVLGAISAAVLGGIGSARGIRTAATQAAGVMSEKPELFGKNLFFFLRHVGLIGLV